MTRRLQGSVLLSLSLSLAALPLLGGCGGGNEANLGVSQTEGAQGPGGGGPPMKPGTRQIMTKLTKGPSSINELLRKELEEGSPPWETIQGQAKEFATESAALGKYDPPRGSKESWEKLTAEWAESAAELDKAAQAKDKDATKAAHTELNTSCMACHREHRQMGRGMGGPGRGRPDGPPAGGPPPEGGFGGPPPPPGGPPPK